MKFIAALVLLTGLFTKSFSQNQNNKLLARQLVEKSIKAMGSDWPSVKTLSLEGYGYQNTLDQSERSEGPYYPVQLRRTFLADIEHGNFKVKQSTESYIFRDTTTYLFNGEAIATQSPAGIAPTPNGQELRDEVNLSPELALNKALASADLIYLKDTILLKLSQSVVYFKSNDFPVRLFLNKQTNLPTAVEITKPFNDDFSSIWGDIKKTIVYSFWMVLGKGVHYPLQQDTYLNGAYKTSFEITKWQVNPDVDASSLQIPDKIASQEKLMAQQQNEMFKQRLGAGAKEIAKGVWRVPGICTSTIVEQPDGIVVIEGPYSSFYSSVIISKAKALFPNKRMKALITTSDAWLHIGGVREFAAIPQITIYHPGHNRVVIEKLLKAPYITNPDAFAKVTKPNYTLTGITDALTVGTGDNQLKLYAYKTATGDRQMMIYFPHHKLLYTSDLYQEGNDPKSKYWNPQIVSEVYQAIKARKIDVQQFYAMHSRGLIAFKDFESDVLKDIE